MLWHPDPAAHDYDAAASYLALTIRAKDARRIADRLRAAKSTSFKAKDILRASALPLLPRDNPDVAKQLGRIAVGEPLSPCLIVRGDLAGGRPAQIADGYHRVCASNYIDEDADIPVRIVGL
ncbi:hypothetical protein HII28_09815 [Planctomonas sp. JC2975]|uniref:hypothetical protein n=1 Tax=Planctomonas sp. JC2975 TaxID=2729626 RepID=UPI001474DB69|nr:hypothetical protein [Planctomonas sp. JC2975]NNC12171.1 hypothetical protein [Planctomonas sp. JC2975]